MESIGIYVSNTPGAVDDATATNALYLMISALRQFSKAERNLRTGQWKAGINPGNAHDATGRTLAVLGLGEAKCTGALQAEYVAAGGDHSLITELAAALKRVASERCVHVQHNALNLRDDSLSLLSEDEWRS